jgi:hypothetical protein
MRDQDAVEAELHILAARRATIQELGGEPSAASMVAADRLLDELGALIAAKRVHAGQLPSRSAGARVASENSPARHVSSP